MKCHGKKYWRRHTCRELLKTSKGRRSAMEQGKGGLFELFKTGTFTTFYYIALARAGSGAQQACHT
jgi:hypothetical protein